MIALATAPISIRVRRKFSAWQFRTQRSLKRAGWAYRYLRGTWTSMDAQNMRYECQDREGFYPLEAISSTRLAAYMQDTYRFPSDARVFLESAVSRTAEKWSERDSDVAFEDAETRALGYAEEHGTPFIEIDDDKEVL